jgi:hypothetical protein
MSRRKPPFSTTQPPGRHRASHEDAKEKLRELASALSNVGRAQSMVVPINLVSLAREHGDTYLGLVSEARLIASAMSDKPDPIILVGILDELVSRAVDRGILWDSKAARRATAMGLSDEEPTN